MNRLIGNAPAYIAVFADRDGIRIIRDATGVKVVYWTQTKDRILFSSEIKALFADPSVRRKMRIGALPEYLTFSFVPGENTMVENVYELQPGSILTYKNNTVSIRRYFRFETNEWQKNGIPDKEKYAKTLRNDLECSVQACCKIGKTVPGIFLSGGIDSSAVLAVLATQYPRERIKTFSIHFGPEYANENEFVSLMTDKYNTDHTWLLIKPKTFLKQMREIVYYLDDPIGDPITIPNFLLAKTAAKKTAVILNGEGGDPCFGGPKNIPMLLALLYGPAAMDKTNAKWVEKNYLRSYKKCFDDLTRMLHPDVLRESGGEDALLSIITPFLSSEKPSRFLNRLMNINIRLKGANLILVKVDKMTSANGILALPPLFSKQIVLQSMACPPQLKLNGNIEKSVLKHAVSDIVPQPIINRPKSGMMVPVRYWFQGEMKRFAKKILSKQHIHEIGFFNYDYVKNLLDYNKEEIQSARYGLKLWMLITFMMWHDQIIEPHDF